MNTQFKTYTKIFIAVFAVAMLAACGGGGDDESAKKKEQLDKLKAEYADMGAQIKALEAELALSDTSNKSKVKDVMISEVTLQPFNHYIDVQGMVDADENVVLSAKTPGTVQRILVSEGSNVSAGQVLAEMESDLYQTQMASLNQNLSYATDLFNRQKKLWDQKIGSEVQYLTAKNNKESIEKQIASLNENIDMTRIKSPINGTVDAVDIKLGQVLAPGAPAIRVVNYSNLKVVGNIAEAYAPKVNKGNEVLVHFPDLNTDVTGTISFTSKVIDPLKRTFSAEVALNGDKSQFRPNMIAVLKIVDYKKEGAIVVPINIVQNSGGEQVVYVAQIEGNKTIAKRKTVTLGSSYNGLAEVTSGLSEHDKLITTGQFDLVDGMQINIK